MDTEKFSEDSPLGIGWLMGHLSLEDAVLALERESGKSRKFIMDKYDITAKDLEIR